MLRALLILAAVAIFAAFANRAIADDVFYPSFNHDPVPPIVTIAPVVHDDVPESAACIPANDTCDDPSDASLAVN